MHNHTTLYQLHLALSLHAVAVVGLERAFYSVREDVGVVEVCAIVYSPTINCPIAFPFNVHLFTRDSTAGNIATDGVCVCVCVCVCEREREGGREGGRGGSEPAGRSTSCTFLKTCL